MKRVWLILVACVISLSVGPIAFAGYPTVTLAWDANSETDLAGYAMSYKLSVAGPPYGGTGILEGDAPIDIPITSLADVANPSITLHELPMGTYYFVVIAYDESGNKSGYSNEVTYVVDLEQPIEPDPVAPGPPENLTVSYNQETNEVTLSWELSSGAPADFWRAYYREAGETRWIGFTNERLLATTLTIDLLAVADGEHKTIEFVVLPLVTDMPATDDWMSEIVALEIDRESPGAATYLRVEPTED